MYFIRLALEIFGLLWLIFIIILAIFGGRILIQLKNPITKKMESVTDITLGYEKEKNPG